MKFTDELGYAHYVYRITNNISSRYYIGIHSVLIKEEFKDRAELINFLITDGYWGSGTDIIKAIKEDGLKNFTKEILNVYSSRKEALLEESRLVTLDLLKDPLSYNLSLGGLGKINIGSDINVIDKKTGKRLCISKKSFEDNKDCFHVYNPMLGKCWITDGTNNKVILKESEIPIGWRLGRSNLKFTKRKSSVRYDYVSIKTGKKIKSSESFDDWLKNYKSSCEYFPVIFFKEDGIFISYNLLQEYYSKCPSWAKISKELNKSIWVIHRIRDFYSHIGKKFESTTKLKRSSRKASKGFLGKTYISNIKTKEILVVNSSDLYKYATVDGWVHRRIRIELIEKIDVILNNYLVSDFSLKKLSRLYNTSENTIKDLLNLQSEEAKVYWLVNSDGRLRHGLYNNKMIGILTNSGWKLVKNSSVLKSL